MKTIAIDLSSDDECEEHNNYLDESIAKVEFNESQSLESDDTVSISVTKQLINYIPKTTKLKNNDENVPIYPPVQNTAKRGKDIQFLQFEEIEKDNGDSGLTDITAKMNKINEQVKNEYCTKEILKSKKAGCDKKHLEEIEEAENSEFESSTFDERMQSNIANASMAESTFLGHKYEAIPQNIMNCNDPDKLPILFIDVKISHDKVARLILYRNQTPVEAAAEFILKHDIPSKLRPYLINKVQAHYEKICESRLANLTKTSN